MDLVIDRYLFFQRKRKIQQVLQRVALLVGMLITILSGLGLINQLNKHAYLDSNEQFDNKLAQLFGHGIDI